MHHSVPDTKWCIDQAAATRRSTVLKSWTLTIDVDASPDAAWAVVGDPLAAPRFYPKYVSAEVDGDTRILTRDDGGKLVERLLERDEAGRSYAYSVIEGAPVRSHRASFTVEENGAGSRIVWSTEAEGSDPAVDMEARLAPSQEGALVLLKAVIEGTA
jgi:Polyketide cyclase / dehydrase and lipid transport